MACCVINKTASCFLNVRPDRTAGNALVSPLCNSLTPRLPWLNGQFFLSLFIWVAFALMVAALVIPCWLNAEDLNSSGAQGSCGPLTCRSGRPCRLASRRTRLTHLLVLAVTPDRSSESSTERWGKTATSVPILDWKRSAGERHGVGADADASVASVG